MTSNRSSQRPAARSITNHFAGAGPLLPQTFTEGLEVWGSTFLQPISQNLFALIEAVTFVVLQWYR